MTHFDRTVAAASPGLRAVTLLEGAPHLLRYVVPGIGKATSKVPATGSRLKQNPSPTFSASDVLTCTLDELDMRQNKIQEQLHRSHHYRSTARICSTANTLSWNTSREIPDVMPEDMQMHLACYKPCPKTRALSPQVTVWTCLDCVACRVRRVESLGCRVSSTEHSPRHELSTRCSCRALPVAHCNIPTNINELNCKSLVKLLLTVLELLVCWQHAQVAIIQVARSVYQLRAALLALQKTGRAADGYVIISPVHVNCSIRTGVYMHGTAIGRRHTSYSE